ncbi:PEGA domain-containing protein [Sorangium sp. So ce426]|uniref:PEGA domain-containing protein n=1 Tax=Sorangium sp. So ce426 TaxID=3133312 RepID=UPI003F5C0FE9
MLTSSQPALAQPSETAAPASAPAEQGAGEQGEDAPRSEEAKEEARARFERGLTLMDQGAWVAAAAEFTVSRKLYPTRNATFHAAHCLRRLQRYDEALEVFEALLREFPKLPQDQKASAQSALDELRALVGTVEIAGAKPGASIVIDGRDRGDYPPVDPIRVAAGAHMVRILKDGYAPFEVRVEIAGGRTTPVLVKHVALTASGRLKVTEQSGKTVDVIVDGDVVGQTPWEGVLSVGDHVVVLRGERNLGTGPATAPVKARERTTLSLRAEELEAMVRVDPTPAGAMVAIDGVPVGRGTWEGALRAGAHRVEVRDEGFVPVVRQLSLGRGQQEKLPIALQRDEGAERWKKPSKFVVDLTAGFAFTPSFGGGVAGGCDGGCSSSFGLGGLGLLHAGYEPGSGVALGVTLGYVLAYQETTTRAATVTPYGLSAEPGTVDDQLRLTGLVAGGSAWWHLGERSPLLLRLGAGVVLGTMRDQRRGFTPNNEGMNADDVVHVDAAESQASAFYLYLDPEARLSVHVGERLELSAGLQALILFAPTEPRFDDRQDVGVSHRVATNRERPGVASYPDDTLTARTVVLFVPSLGARYAF